MREACRYLDAALAIDVESLGAGALVAAARTSLASKVVGA